MKDLAGRITNKQAAIGTLILLPYYHYCAPIIFSILLVLINIIIPMDENTMNMLLNLVLQITCWIFIGILFKDFIKENISRFLDHIGENTLFACTKGIAIMYGVNIVTSLIVSLILHSDTNSVNEQYVNLLAGLYPAAMCIQACILAPVTEEMIFRGLIFRGLYDFNPKLAYFVSALLFGFIHVSSEVMSGNFTELIYLLVYGGMGLVLCYCYDKKENICVPILVHMLNNFICMIVILL